MPKEMSLGLRVSVLEALVKIDLANRGVSLDPTTISRGADAVVAQLGQQGLVVTREEYLLVIMPLVEEVMADASRAVHDMLHPKVD